MKSQEDLVLVKAILTVRLHGEELEIPKSDTWKKEHKKPNSLL